MGVGYLCILLIFTPSTVKGGHFFKRTQKRQPFFFGALRWEVLRVDGGVSHFFGGKGLACMGVGQLGFGWARCVQADL